MLLLWTVLDTVGLPRGVWNSVPNGLAATEFLDLLEDIDALLLMPLYLLELEPDLTTVDLECRGVEDLFCGVGGPLSTS